MNISIVDSFAADCDGDEMNIFVPNQNTLSTILFTVAANLFSFKNGKCLQKLK